MASGESILYVLVYIGNYKNIEGNCDWAYTAKRSTSRLRIGLQNKAETKVQHQHEHEMTKTKDQDQLTVNQHAASATSTKT